MVGLGLYLMRSMLRIQNSQLPGGLYVYLRVYGVDIKGDFTPQISVHFLNPGVGLVGHVKALSFQIV